jgi:hypothetical protein
MRDWLELKFVMLGFWAIIIGAVAFSAAPIVF